MTSVPQIAPPRAIERTATYVGTAVTLPAIILTMYLVGAIIGVPNVILHKRLRDHGIDGTARITERYTTQSKQGIVCHVVYAFTLGSSRFEEMSIVSPEAFAALAIGSPVPILYEASPRHRAALNIDDRERQGLGYEAALATLKLVTGLAAFPSILWPLGCHIVKGRQARLLRWGAFAPGRIVGEREYQSKRGRLSEIRYAFETETGQTVSGFRKGVPAKSASRPDDIALRAQSIESPVVIYDPEKPERNALYPLSFVRLRG